MVRLTLLYLLISFLAIYAFRDWYKSTCGLIVLMAFMQHPDMPTNILGIQGFNPWNVLMLCILISWFFSRRKEGLRWNMPRFINVLLIGYLVIIVVSFSRMITDTALVDLTMQNLGMHPMSKTRLTADYLVNSVKWIIPGLLICHGCNSRSRVNWAMAAIILFYVLLAAQVIRWMPLSELSSGNSINERGAKLIENEIGYHRVDVAMMLAGGFWACFVVSTASASRTVKWLLYGCCATILLGLALTGGRTGYGTWLLTGIVLATIRWRRFLVILPIGMVIVSLTMPFVTDRLTQGFSGESAQKNVRLEKSGIYERSDDGPDLYTVTSGRIIAWPFVIEKISEEPWTGYGRLAMMRTGIANFLVTNYGETFPHPHNAYLEQILDNGFPAALFVFFIFFLFWKRSISMIRHTHNPNAIKAGGALGSILTAQLIASIGAQSFYPNADVVSLWAAIGLMLRVGYSRGRERQRGRQRSRRDQASHAATNFVQSPTGTRAIFIDNSLRAHPD